jgi:5-methylcytosine-specific restriction endonuclease McrA
MDKLSRLVLTLNASYEPLLVISAKRALTLVMGGKAVVEEPSQHLIHTSKMAIRIPSVIRLLQYRRIPRQNRAVSRKSIMLRDRYTCQYCMHVFEPQRLTLDHVIPKSRGGCSNWENLVAACYPCNNRKSDRTPVEAGMLLARKPAQIGIHAKHRLMVNSEECTTWDKYLFC